MANIAVTGISALAGVVMARGFGPVGRGQVAIVLSWFAVVQAVSEVGLSGATVYFAARYPSQNRQLLRSIRRLYLGQGILGAVVAIGILHFLSFPVNVRAGLTTAFALMPLAFWMGAPLQVCQALSLRNWNVARLGQALFYLLGLILLLQTGQLSVVNVTIVFLGGSAAGGLIAATFGRSATSCGDSEVTRVSSNRIYSYARSNWAWTVLTIVGLRLDQLTLSVFASAQQLGLYVTAASYMALVSPLLSAVGVVTFTTAARGSAITARNARMILGLTSVTSFGAAGLLAILAPRIIPLIFGQDFIGASHFAVLLAVGTASSGIKQVAANLLLGKGRPSTAARLEAIYVSCLAASLFLGVILFGASGVAISFSIVTVIFALVTAIIAGSSKPSVATPQRSGYSQ